MIDLRGLTLYYRDAAEPALADVDLHVARGELALLAGPTGCGKSSLLGCINGIVQHETDARVQGRATLDGADLHTLPLPHICRLAGTVWQNPHSQICTSTVETEVAFALENLAVPRAQMQQRIDEALDVVGLAALRRHATDTLSGGQKQRLAIACALALQPQVLLLDEPISQLDPAGARDILALVGRLKQSQGLTVVMAEHRIDETIHMADRLVLIDGGRVVSNRTRDDALQHLDELRDRGMNLPLLADLFQRLGRPERPLSADEAPPIEFDTAPPPPPDDDRPAMCHMEQLEYRYRRRGHDVLRGVDATLRRGDRVAVMGPNGSGKSTLLHLLAGLQRPDSGSIAWTDQRPSLGLVVQEPDLMLFSETVRDEVAFAPIHQHLPRPQRQPLVDDVLDRTGLTALADRPPLALSRGQRLRAAVASVLSKQPEVLLLDEPTTGQDRRHIEQMMSHLEDQCDAMVFCTHDVQTAARHANRIWLLVDGRIIADGPPHEVLFDESAMQRASLRPSAAQAYAARLGVRALDVDELLRRRRP